MGTAMAIPVRRATMQKVPEGQSPIVARWKWIAGSIALVLVTLFLALFRFAGSSDEKQANRASAPVAQSTEWTEASPQSAVEVTLPTTRLVPRASPTADEQNGKPH